MITLALKNCRRNIRRTVLTGTAVLFAIWVVIVMLAFMRSMLTGMIENNKDFECGDIRIRTASYSEFEDALPLQFYLPDVERKLQLVSSLPDVSFAEAVSKIPVSVYRDGDLTTVTAVGVDASTSRFAVGKSVTVLSGRMIETGKNEVVLTKRLLSKLGLSLGDSVTLLSKTATGGTNGASYRIVGTVSYANAQYNGDVLVMPLSQLDLLGRMPGGALELYAHLVPDVDPNDAAQMITQALSDPSLEIKTWKQVTVIAAFLPMYDVMFLLIEILFFCIASTLIFNTTMMAVMERKREISTMIALGFSRSSIIRLFVTESAIVSFIAAVLATVGALLAIFAAGVHGIDLSAMGADAVQGWGFSQVLYPTVSVRSACGTAGFGFAVAVIAALLASRGVRKIEAAQALREED
ncbi:MAG: ABC transporter permease [Sphaerochaeta sp.]|jgi:putative ABC transport system permease protein|nr:ABC transporter permease [Sphaerochaeta sp.]MCI2096672.1 ABC transporter permease [Sphaerochaeta sp.]MCI2103668.1 ABC transporter permease [Sphaerochaeta sp.]